MGDVVDGFTIVTTVAGVCTSLGLGAINIVAGFQYLGWVQDDISQGRLTWIQNLTIWGITALATISVLSGLHHGVQLLSKVAFCFGMLLFLLIFVMVCPLPFFCVSLERSIGFWKLTTLLAASDANQDNTKFLMNLQIQEVGYYAQ